MSKFTQVGVASRYEDDENADGSPVRSGDLTAAHKTLEFGTMVRITRRDNGKNVVVTIHDRGPFTKGRIIDLRPAAAEAIGLTEEEGIAHVMIETLGEYR